MVLSFQIKVKNKMSKFKSIFKEVLQTKFQILIFIFCLVLSIGTFVSIDSLRVNVEDFTLRDSKTLNGGDIIIDSNREFSDNLTYAVENVKLNYPNLEFVNSYTFSSVVYAPKTDSSLLSEIRVITNKYPLYGQAVLKSERDFSDVLISGNVIVQSDLLVRLNLEVGDELKVGDKTFIIADVILVEPDQPLELFVVGPRVFISEVDLEAINLVGDKSRVFYETLIKTSGDDESKEIIDYINGFTIDRESAEFYFDDSNSLTRFTTNFLFFIKMIALFIIIIAGIGMTSIIFSYLEDKKLSIGIRKSLGERDKDILSYYYLTILLVSVVATIFAILFAYVLIKIFPIIFESILPPDVNISLSYFAVIKGVIVSLIISTLFTLYPLLSLSKIKPIQIFRLEDRNLFSKDKSFYLINSLIIIFFTIFVFVEIEDFWFSFWLVLGSLWFFIVLFFISKFTLAGIKKLKNKISYLELRQAINGLFRIGNKTILVITSVALSLTIIFTISFVEANLQNQFVTSFPENAPNFFVIDIPKENLSEIQEIVGEDIIFYPSIRGSLLSVNGVDTKTIEETASGFGDSLTRTFTLTYGDLLESERIIESGFDSNSELLFDSNWNKEIVQVSVLDEIGDRFNAKIGDKLVFLIQGIEIEAEITTIRERVNQGIAAYFYFTFETEVLENAPQTIFTISRVDGDRIPVLQNEIVKKFPGVTVINGESTAKSVGEIIGKLSYIVSFFTLFSLGAGILILLSSIVSTNTYRTQEAVFYKLVGANKSFIRKVFIFEYLIIGFISSLIAVVLASFATFAITEFFLEINFIFLFKETIIYSLLTIFVIVLIGYLSSLNVFRKKPIEYIRENSVE